MWRRLWERSRRRRVEGSGCGVMVVGVKGLYERTSSLSVGKVAVVRKVTVVREVDERLRNYRD